MWERRGRWICEIISGGEIWLGSMFQSKSTDLDYLEMMGLNQGPMEESISPYGPIPNPSIAF